MNNTVIGKATMDECKELKKLVERKMGLVELSKTLAKANKEVYEQVVADLGATEFSIKDWWTRISVLYRLEMIPGANIRINFETGDIIAVLPEKNQEIQVF